MPTNPIIPHIDKISSLFRSIALGGSDKQRRICPVSGTVPGPLFRGLPRTLLPGSRGRARPRRGIRRIFDGGALGAPTLPSPRYPAHGQGHGAFSRRGSLPRSSFLPKLRASDFCPISCRFRSGYCPSPPTRHDPGLGDAGIIPYLRPFDQPRLCELFWQRQTKKEERKAAA